MQHLIGAYPKDGHIFKMQKHDFGTRPNGQANNGPCGYLLQRQCFDSPNQSDRNQIHPATANLNSHARPRPGHGFRSRPLQDVEQEPRMPQASRLNTPGFKNTGMASTAVTSYFTSFNASWDDILYMVTRGRNRPPSADF